MIEIDPVGIPGEITNENQWVLWKLVWKPDKKGRGKWDKVPYQVNGRRASSTDSTTWNTFAAVWSAYRRGDFDGIGFVLANGFVGIDLDNVVNPETEEGCPNAKALVREFKTYAEGSPSGTGVKLFGRGTWPGNWHRKPFGENAEIEVYDHGRYFALTGRAVNSRPVVDIQAALDDLAKSFALELRPTIDTSGDATAAPLGDDEILERARVAKNGARFRRLWNGDTSDYAGDQSRADLALCGMLAFWCRGDAARVNRLFRRSALMRDKWDEPRGDETYGERTIATAIGGLTKHHGEENADHERGANEGKPAILIDTDEHRVNREAADALSAEPDLYQRGGILVHVIEPDDNTVGGDVVRRPTAVPMVRELSSPLLRERMTRCARWLRRADEGLVGAHPPGWAVAAIHGRGTWPGVRPLNAIATHPLLLPDGTILNANGYHGPTGILIRLPHGPQFSVPESPSREDVAEAVARLSEVVCDFPFDRPEHRAAWFASLLTPVAWFAFDGPAPWFIIDKNVRGAGAGLLADVVALLITGRRFPVMSYTSEREELRKRITTLAIEGERLVLLDNLAGAVGNDVLDAALTSDQWKDRLLGANRVYNGPLHVCWYGTGNNVELRADTARRVCHIRMETPEERPELRTGFKYPNLRAHVRENRGQLLSAALTILRGWIMAGRPRHGLPAWGSFEGWSGLVREAVVFAGLPDPGETRLALQNAADRDAVTMDALLSALERMDPGGRGVTTAEIIDAIRKPTEYSEVWTADLKCAVEELCGKSDGRTLGYRFRHFSRRNFNGRMLDKANPIHGANRWVVRPGGIRGGPNDVPHVTHHTPDGGHGGDGGHVSDGIDFATNGRNRPSGDEPTSDDELAELFRDCETRNRREFQAAFHSSRADR